MKKQIRKKTPFIILLENIITRGSNLDLTPAAKVETVEEVAEKQADTFLPLASVWRRLLPKPQPYTQATALIQEVASVADPPVLHILFF